MSPNQAPTRPNRALRFAAERAAGNSYHLAYALRSYREGKGITEQQLAEYLECDPAELASLALCRCPGVASMDIEADLDHLAARFHLNRARLAEVVRFGAVDN